MLYAMQMQMQKNLIVKKMILKVMKKIESEKMLKCEDLNLL